MTFEGTEGAGKTTLIRAVSTQLLNVGFRVTLTREPGGTKTAEQIRSLILTPPEAISPWTELFLYEAARAEHLAKTIQPALGRNEIVLCDRFTDSTLAYQGHARGLPWKKVKTLNTLATLGVAPDMTVLLDIDPATGLKRARDPNRFEAEGVEFQKKVRAGFLKSRKENPKRWLVLQASRGTPELLAQTVIQGLIVRFKSRLDRLNKNGR